HHVGPCPVQRQGRRVRRQDLAERRSAVHVHHRVRPACPESDGTRVTRAAFSASRSCSTTRRPTRPRARVGGEVTRAEAMGGRVSPTRPAAAARRPGGRTLPTRARSLSAAPPSTPRPACPPPPARSPHPHP